MNSFLPAPDAVLVAQEFIRLRNWEQAREFCENWQAAFGRLAALSVCEAVAQFGAGNGSVAMQILRAVLAEQRTHHSAALALAQMLVASASTPETGADSAAGESARAEAWTLLHGVVSTAPDFPGACAALSTTLLPGPYYRKVLEQAHYLLRPRGYLEIGVETGATLALALTAVRAVGVDPASEVRVALSDSARHYQMESDKFFSTYSRQQVFADVALDLAFVDGLHHYDQVLRDFMHVEAWSSPHTVVVLHDCVPVHPRVAARTRHTKFWTGDTWKALSILRELRPDLEINVIPTAPSGLAFVRGLDASSTVLREKLSAAVVEYRDVPCPADAREWLRAETTLGNTEAGLRRALGMN